MTIIISRLRSNALFDVLTDTALIDWQVLTL